MNNQKNKLEKIKSMKLLQLWGQMPNPDHQFFSKKGISFHKALRDITYSPEVQSAVLARESAVIGDPWQITSDSDSPSADFITENLNTMVLVMLI